MSAEVADDKRTDRVPYDRRHNHDRRRLVEHNRTMAAGRVPSAIITPSSRVRSATDMKTVFMIAIATTAKTIAMTIVRITTTSRIISSSCGSRSSQGRRYSPT